MPRLLPLIALLLSVSLPLGAQVRRCTAADGTMVFTDRRCADLGAVERVPRTAPNVPATAPLRGSCSHTLPDLVYELTSAIDSRDVNRFAGVYYWTGTSTSTGYAVMGRLQAIVQRPLVDVSPLFPGRVVDDYYPQTTVRHAPVGLRLEQTLANGSTPSRTVLGLRRYLGCWFVQL